MGKLRPSSILILVAACEGCSLLAPSRDELSGGKIPTKIDGAAPDSSQNASGGGGSASGAGGGEDERDEVGRTDGASAEAESEISDGGQEAPIAVLACNNLGQVGQWQLMTPPDVSVACPETGYCANGGPEQFVLDPLNAGTIYLGTSAQGIWKSTDCGGTWKQINTGTNSTTLSAGSQYGVFEIDHVDSQVMYTTGANSALFKSTDGGVDWNKIWPPQDAMLASIVPYNTVRALGSDLLNHLHFILSFATKCSGAGLSGICFAETMDGGSSWQMLSGRPEWTGEAQGARVWILDATSRLYSSGADGLWRSSDKGVTWQQLADVSVGQAESRLYRTTDGTFYIGGISGIFRSTDGVVWSKISGPQSVTGGIASDGTTLFASSFGVCSEWGTNLQLYTQSAVTDGKTWNPLLAPAMNQGAVALDYDRQHHVLYSSNCRQGFWRVVTH